MLTYLLTVSSWQEHSPECQKKLRTDASISLSPIMWQKKILVLKLALSVLFALQRSHGDIAPCLPSLRDEICDWLLMNKHLVSKTYWSWLICHRVFHLPRSPIEGKYYQPPFQRQNAFCIVYELGNVKALWLQHGSCFDLFWFKSGNESFYHFLNIMAPTHLWLVVFHLHGAFHLTTTFCQGPLRISEFCWVSLKLSSAFSSFE